MGKTIDIPDSIAKTQIVEELFRNMKDAPEHNQSANAVNAAKSINHDFQDVVALGQAKSYEKIDEEGHSGYSGSGQNADKPEEEEEPQKEPENTESAEEEKDQEEDPEKPYNKKGILLDIKG